MSIKCPKCAAENSDGAKFCKNCGQDLTPLANSVPSVAVADRICGKCGTPNSSAAKFCKLCGTPVAVPDAPPVAPKPALAPVPAAAPRPLPEGDPDATISPTSVQAHSETPSQMTDFDVTIKQLTAPIKPKAAAPVGPGTTGQRGNQKSTRYLLWGGIAAACLAVAGAIYWYASQSGASVATLAPSSAAAPAPLPPPAPIAVPDTVPVPMPEPTPAPAPVVEPSPTSVPAPDIIGAPSKTPLKPIAATPERKKPSPRNKPAPLAAPAPTPVPEAIKEAPMTTLPTRPAPQPAPPIGPSSPREACGGRIFLALAMCMQEQCETPKFRNHAQCIELRQQRQAIEDRNNNR